MFHGLKTFNFLFIERTMWMVWVSLKETHTHENTHKHTEHKHIHSYIDAHAKQMQFDQQ